jgi:cold shock CspA family protein
MSDMEWNWGKKSEPKVEPVVEVKRHRVRCRGYVDKWFEEKGYGFVAIDGETIFLHVTKLVNYVPGESKVRQGSYIELSIVNAVKGRQAIDVAVLEY